MSDKGVEDITLDSWEELEELSRVDLGRVAEQHAKLMKTKEGLRKVAKFHALEIFGIDPLDMKVDVLNYARTEELDPVALRTILEEEPIASFSRVKDDKQTGTYIYDRGKLFEAVHTYSDGTAVRVFHNFFHDPKRKNHALKGQEYHNALADYVRHQVSCRDMPGRDILRGHVEKLNAIKPLNHTRNTLNNVFLHGEDLKEHLKDADEEYTLNVLEEVNAIDMILSVFSDRFKKTKKGRKLYGKAFKPTDYRIEVFEEIMLPADKDLFSQLKESGLVRSNGKVSRIRDVEEFLRGDSEQAGVMELLGVNDYSGRENFFTSGDANLGNTMINGGYTQIDFEGSKEDEIFSAMAKRYLEAGVYGLNKENKEEEFLPKAHEVYNAARKATGKKKITSEAFKMRYGFHKKKHLLRLVRRYSHYETTDANPEKMKLRKEVFYNLFVDELVNEGKVSGIEDEKLAYLNRLFNPLENLEGRVEEVFGGRNPTYFSVTDVNPLEAAGRQKKKDDIDRRIADITRLKRKRSYRLFGGIAAVVLAVAGSIFGGYMAHKASNKVAEMETKYEGACKDLSMEQKLKIIRVYQSKGRGYTNMEVSGINDIKAWKKVFGDEKMAFLAFLDYETLYDAMQKSGKKGAKSISSYLSTAKVGEETQKRYGDLWITYISAQDCVDNWAKFGNVHTSPSERADGYVQERMRKVQESYREFKEMKVKGNFANYFAQKEKEAYDQRMRELNGTINRR